MCVCAHLSTGSWELLEKQNARVDLIAQAPTELLVFQWLMDETKFRMLLRLMAAKKRPDVGEASVLAVHGRLLWASGDNVQEEEVVFSPLGISANTAAGTWGALLSLLPPALRNILLGLTSVDMVVLAPGADMFSANQMMIQHIDNITAAAADKICVLGGWCHQHKSGNALEPVSRRTAIMRPLFCIARRMRAEAFSKRFREGRKTSLKLSMKHLKGSDFPDWRPEQADLDHAAVVMELFYYRKDVRNSDDPDQAEDAAAQVKTAETLRRKRGVELLKRFRRGEGKLLLYRWNSCERKG